MSDDEAARQRALLRAIHQRSEQPVPGLLGLVGRAGQGASMAAGLGAYRAHAQSVAVRALAAAYPTVQQLVGPGCFAGLARALWQRQPPLRGDLACFGESLEALLTETEALAEEPYLPDVARLEWAVHQASSAADHGAAVVGLALLGEAEPAVLRVAFVPGTALVSSRFPIVAVWQAHQAAAGEVAEELAEDVAEKNSPDGDRFTDVRQAWAEGRQDEALVWRRGWRVAVERLSNDESAFTQALMAGQSLGEALERMRPLADFSFEAWLLRALRGGWLVGFAEGAATSRVA